MKAVAEPLRTATIVGQAQEFGGFSPEQRGSAMDNQIDEAFRRAILREIGERLQACLTQEELPANLRAQLHELRRLDDQSLRDTRNHPPHKRTVARWLVSRMRRRKRQR